MNIKEMNGFYMRKLNSELWYIEEKIGKKPSHLLITV